MRRRSERRAACALGFTLIEVMTVVAVIALLAAVAYPTYQSAVMKSRRTEAKAALTDAAQRLERYYTENNHYTGAQFCGPVADPACTDASRISSDSSENGFYGLGFAVNAPTASTFTIVATPRGTQAGDPCGSFTLNQAGDRRVSGGTQTDASKCW